MAARRNGDTLRWLDTLYREGSATGMGDGQLLERFLSTSGAANAPQAWSKGAAVPGVEYLWSRDTAHGGKASLCLKKTAPRYFPIAQWFQKVDRVGDTLRLKVSAWVKAEQASKAILDA